MSTKPFASETVTTSSTGPQLNEPANAPVVLDTAGTTFVKSISNFSEIEEKSTLDLIKEIKYSQAYSFKYSIRPGTPAAISLNQVDEAYKKSRLEEVQNILRDQQLEFNKQSINSGLKILVLKNGKKPNQYLGRSQYNQSVYFNCNEKNIIGSTVNIKVTEAFQNSLTGNIINI